MIENIQVIAQSRRSKKNIFLCFKKIGVKKILILGESMLGLAYLFLTFHNTSFPLRSSPKCIFCSILFSFFLGCSLATTELYTMERNCDDICLVMISSYLIHNFIGRRNSPYLLSEFLKSRFWIYKE
jgi:hypothetical protein